MTTHLKSHSEVKTVERGWFGRLLGLPPKVYVCHGLDGVWREEHEGPLWYVGGGPMVPCMNCTRRVIPFSNYLPRNG